MAQVRNRAGTDAALEYSLRAWDALPGVAEEISSWEPDDRIDFVYEWPLEEQRLLRLHTQATSGRMTEEQLERYHELEDVVERNRPIIEEIKRAYNT
jgi:hypothetical protein